MAAIPSLDVCVCYTEVPKHLIEADTLAERGKKKELLRHGLQFFFADFGRS